MLTIQGPNALSNFRKNKLLQSIQRQAPNIKDLKASYLHFIDCDDALISEKENEMLIELLCYGEPIKKAPETGVLIAPRPGTISPWSSKATDIVQNCGLNKIKRVERGIIYTFHKEDLNKESTLTSSEVKEILPFIHDKMTEALIHEGSEIFKEKDEKKLQLIPVMKEGIAALKEANVNLGLALSDDEIEYLLENYQNIKRDPTDVELVMFAQANSEHCRHKIFNADWIIDNEEMPISLFKMIQNTHKLTPENTIIAYNDNAAVIKGFPVERFLPKENKYTFYPTEQHIVAKVETHNHPTAICPYPGASTGTGGEIRDESATGIGGKPKAGLSAFFVSNLNLKDNKRPWEKDFAEFPSRIATPLQIMTEGPLGACGFANEFGRPNLTGIFRTYEQKVGNTIYGYHKPIMAAGGIGSIEGDHIKKSPLKQGDLIIQLGGPSMLIGLGGGAASSMDTGENSEDLDFDSVQRDNPEMERRCQEVIDRCVSLGSNNPILSIHDVGAGGLSNACPELVADVGATFYLREIDCKDPSMSPMEIWCNESQERYVLAISPESLKNFEEICIREKCPMAIIGEVTGDKLLKLQDSKDNTTPIDLELAMLLGKPPKMLRNVKHIKKDTLSSSAIKDLENAISRVLKCPAVADKTFLITIGDRSVTGLVARDQMVGKYQVPVADVAVTSSDYLSHHGEAMAMGERTPVAILDAKASARLAVSEALTNLFSADIDDLKKIKLSANWMAACGVEGQDANLYDAVKAIGMEFCPALGLSIPVGKDSMSMRTSWKDSNGETQNVVSPLSLIITAYAPVNDVRKTITPEIKDVNGTALYLLAPHRKTRLGSSILAQVFNETSEVCPDISAEEAISFFQLLIKIKSETEIFAYHDRSDGGLLTSLLEMSFCSRKGLQIQLNQNFIEDGFNEEIGTILQLNHQDYERIKTIIFESKFEGEFRRVAQISNNNSIDIFSQDKKIYSNDLLTLKSMWSETSWQIQRNRDNPHCADEEFTLNKDPQHEGINIQLNFETPKVLPSHQTQKPKMAILREQGVNGQIEMAAAFTLADFEAIDVTMSDLISQKVNIQDFNGLVACGGFSYGDVLGAGSGWAKSILFHERLRDDFKNFFHNPKTFSLGICNGCQMLSQLKELIPGAQWWPRFVKNKSEQFEARYVSVKINKTPSIFFDGMEDSIIPIVCAHGEGQVLFENENDQSFAFNNKLITTQYVDSKGSDTEIYPLNPNGSIQGVTGFTSENGQATIMMPHPERLFRSNQYSWINQTWGEYGPWMKMFINARKFIK